LFIDAYSYVGGGRRGQKLESQEAN